MSDSTNAPVEACPKCGVLRPFLPPEGWCSTCGYSPIYEARIKEAFGFLAATSLCEGCQKKREERRIIATPRIQVEEELDRLRADSAMLDRLLDPEGPFYIAHTEQVKNLSFYGGIPDRVHTRDEIDEVLGDE